MENKKVVIESLVKKRVVLNVPELKLNRVWEKKGAKKTVDFDVLSEAIYNPGVEYMFTQGILSIDDMEVKIALGLEPEGAKTPVNTIVLTEAQMQRLLTVAPLQDLKDAVKKMTNEQKKMLVEFAVEKELVNLDKCDYLKEVTGKDIIGAVRINRQSKEE